MNRILPSSHPVRSPPGDPGAFRYQASITVTEFLGDKAVQGQA
jgi:hypothetical protein